MQEDNGVEGGSLRRRKGKRQEGLGRSKKKGTLVTIAGRSIAGEQEGARRSLMESFGGGNQGILKPSKEEEWPMRDYGGRNSYRCNKSRLK